MSVHQLYRVHRATTAQLMEMLEPGPEREPREAEPEISDLQDLNLSRKVVQLWEEREREV